MSPDEIRTELAQAVNGTAGIKCSTHYRQSLKAGDAFVRFASRGRDGSTLGYADTWQVWVALSQDVTTAERWLDEHLDEVCEALTPVLNLNTTTPAELALGGNTVSGVIFEGIREAG